MADVVVLVLAEGERLNAAIMVQATALVTPPLLRTAFARAPEEASSGSRQPGERRALASDD